MGIGSLSGGTANAPRLPDHHRALSDSAPLVSHHGSATRRVGRRLRDQQLRRWYDVGLLAWAKKKDPPTCRVEVTSHGITVSGARDDLLLDLLLREGFDAPFACRAGSCGECKCRLLEGKVKERLDTAYVL
ncbi:MAG: 2Fe-2S iron-sulfur cluster binding domain-containing protein, partial [bacterium]|nr:2Fe-2S iron-sulfur cluster binding domain-containing protein [bacterium]